MKGLKYISLLVFLIASICLEDCWAVDTISITHPIQDPDSIVSSGQTFKLGFFSPENTRDRYVGIMYNVPGQTVVWVANRDRPLNDSSGIFTISGDGNLVVLNGKKEILWSSNLQKPVANSSAQLRDVGDLVLKDNSGGTVLWESFQNPTDSFLRTMRIGVTANKTIQLSSWRSPSDPSIGSFTLGVDPLRIPECFVWNRSKLHWRGGPWNGSIFIGVDGMDSVYRNRFNLETDNSGTAYCTYDFENTSSLLHYELTSWGDVQERVYYGNGDWNVTYSCVRSECDVYGKCGPFGICDPRSSPICTCLRGFEPRDKEGWSKGNWTGGCFRRALLQCERNGSAAEQGKGDGFLRLTMIKVPDMSFYVALPNEECKKACLNNCSCTAYSFVMGIGCLHWSSNLLDVQQFSLTGTDLYVRAAYSELDHAIGKRIKIAIIATTVTVGSLFLAVSLYFLWKWFIKHRGNKQEAELSLIEAAEVGKGHIMLNDNTEKSKLEELPIYSYETLANATDNFHIKNVLGKGGFGPVYKGKLKDGPEVAVKRLSNSSNQGIKEFMNEVMVISKLQHRNLVRLLGCCVEREEKMLVYEYMPNKSLDAYIFDSQKQDLLDWNRRVVIIEGIGRGLLYLHRDSRLRIIHRDLKASNILLDEELHPKISDFGLARIFGGKQDQANTSRVVGTYGYMAPEYAMGGKFSEKSDVYSFGVLLLEIVSGKRNTSFYHAEGLSLVGYAWKLWNEKETLKLVDTAIFDPSIETEILRYVHVGLLCIQESEKDRPNVSTALLMLNSEFGELPRVKLPAYTARLALSENENSPATGNSDYSVNDVSLTDVSGR